MLRGSGDRWLPADTNSQQSLSQHVHASMSVADSASSSSVVDEVFNAPQVEELMKQDAVFVAMEELMLALEEER
jgi:hypothetical protein